MVVSKQDVIDHWDRANERVGACPSCNELNEDKYKLASKAVKQGLSLPVSAIDFSSTMKNWPEPVIDDDAIVSKYPLEIECQNCGNTYSP